MAAFAGKPLQKLHAAHADGCQLGWRFLGGLRLWGRAGYASFGLWRPIALLIWGIRWRTGILAYLVPTCAKLIARGVRTRITAVLSGIGVTAIVQSSTALLRDGALPFVGAGHDHPACGAQLNCAVLSWARPS